MQTKSKLQEWALDRCKAWNWNCNVAEIAKELIDADIDVDGARFRALEKEFVKFFPTDGEQQIETIRDIMETFG
jgi:hypothetical protein